MEKECGDTLTSIIHKSDVAHTDIISQLSA